MIDEYKYLLKTKYRLLSKKGKNLGTYDTKKEAEKREKQVNFFKYLDSKKKK